MFFYGGGNKSQYILVFPEWPLIIWVSMVGQLFDCLFTDFIFL